MTITPLDLKLRQSERMTDFADGGGRMSATEVIDGALNNVFSDLSDANGIIGNVSLRKIFFQVDTANTDTFLDPFVFLTDLPQNDNVGVCVFDTQSATDERAKARNYVESYRIKSVKSQFTLYGAHFVGQQTIQVYCRAETASPDIGDVLCLSIERSGYAPAEQYVAIREVLSRQTVTFTDAQGDFERDVLILRLTSALQSEFPGMDDPIRYTLQAPPPTVVRFTQVSESARFHGFKPLIALPAAGDTVVTVGDPYIPIVPSTQGETPLVDQLAGFGALSMIPCGAPGGLTFSGSVSAAAGVLATRYFGTPYAPGSLAITAGAVALRDDGIGGIEPVDPLNTGWSGSADYATGAFSLARDSGLSGTVTATATAAGGVVQQTTSLNIAIGPPNRTISYVFQIPGQPSPGTVHIDYLALGKWIRLADAGRGRIAGRPSEGSATINYATGALQLTLGALPDLDSAIIVSWGTDLRARDSHGEITVPPPTYRQQLDHEGITPGTLTMAWVSGGAPRTASADAYGVISGDAAGRIKPTLGVVEFTTAHAPDAAEAITYSYTYTAGLHSETFTPTAAGGAVTVTLTHAPVEPGTVTASWNTRRPDGSFATGQLIVPYLDVPDDGLGGFVTPNQGVNTVDYSAGDVVLTVEQLIGDLRPVRTRYGPESNRVGWYISDWVSATTGYTFLAGSPLVIRYAEAGAGATSASESHTLPPIRIYLGAGSAGPTVAGSLRFSFRGLTYVDRAGSLYHSIDPLTNAGTLAGSYDYASNTATLTEFGASGSAVAIQSLLTRYVDTGVTAAFFRTSGAPLRIGAFTLRATTMHGTLLTATVDANGVIAGAQIAGKVEWRTGLVDAAFGALVTAAGNEAEEWYDPDAVDGDGKIWRPETVDPASIFFGTVVYTSIPVDANLIGLDPVRLPNDGRVVGFNPGSLAVVSHTDVTQVSAPTAGAVIDLGRERLSFVEVFDAARKPVESVWYTLDMDAGTLTFANPLNLSAYTLPLSIRHRIQDVGLVSDVQITGEITFATPLTHTYPAGAIVSSALLWNSLQARVTNLFDQATYQAGVWKDVVDGNPAAATYNSVTYPLEVANDAAIEERWAIRFTSPTIVDVIGETVGQVITGASIAADIAPINPVTVTTLDPVGKPYFTIRKEGWGGGWQAGNVLRFNAISATHPLWLARTVTPGEIAHPNDRVRIQAYGNAH